jgi:NAD(P)-dependent dehydrogenase (short-subunit alcohol dehydrogenase family)
VVSEFYGRKLDLGNLQGERKFSYFGAYRASKLGEVLFTTELARRIKGSGVTVVSVSPGPARTNFALPSGVLGVVLDVMQHTPMFKPAGQAAGESPGPRPRPSSRATQARSTCAEGSFPSRARRRTSRSPPGYGASASSRRESTQLARPPPPSQPPAGRLPDPAAATSRDSDGPGSCGPGYPSDAALAAAPGWRDSLAGSSRESRGSPGNLKCV